MIFFWNFKNLYLKIVQINIKYGDQVYLPYSVGILQSYVNQNKLIKDNFKFKEFIFLREHIDIMVQKIGKVDVLGISTYVWNYEISLKLAEEVKKFNPNCLVFFGGPQVPDEVEEEFFNKYKFIDLLFHGEGEKTFEEVLLRYLNNQRLDNILSTTYFDRKTKKLFKNKKRERIKDYLIIPSPYLNGTFDNILSKYNYKWMATWETNRGCPFKCSFCDWGSATASKLYKFDEKRLFDEIDYFTKKKFDLIFGADANFGILKRDLDLTKKLALNKKKFGYPNQFRVCFTKNSTEQVFNLARIFSEVGMNKGVSVSMQSMDQETLNNIKRNNIKLNFFKDLQKKYVSAGLVTYTELILPLPGETYSSFVEGIDNLLDSSQHSGIIVYNSSIMPNAEMGTKTYQKRHGIKTTTIPIFQAHSNFDKENEDGIQELEEIVVETNTMSLAEWKKTFKFSILLQSLHVLGLSQLISIILRYDYGIKYSDFYNSILNYGTQYKNSVLGKELSILDSLLENVVEGKGFDQKVEEFENITWPPEEAMFLRIQENFKEFYIELTNIVKTLLRNKNLENKFITNLVDFQRQIVFHYGDRKDKIIITNYNFGDHFKKLRSGEISSLESGKFETIIKLEKVFNNKKQFSREIVWYGRKGGKFLHNFLVKDKNINSE